MTITSGSLRVIDADCWFVNDGCYWHASRFILLNWSVKLHGNCIGWHGESNFKTTLKSNLIIYEGHGGKFTKPDVWYSLWIYLYTQRERCYPETQYRYYNTVRRRYDFHFITNKGIWFQNSKIRLFWWKYTNFEYTERNNSGFRQQSRIQCSSMDVKYALPAIKYYSLISQINLIKIWRISPTYNIVTHSIGYINAELM